jgi:tetrahydromethanopterin S-methyltransferase subunit A|tara:strand:+ start:81 stop:323 length:243 start_codon:yes stop_codon:yes gene_type:complete
MTSSNNLNVETAREYIMLVVAIITAIAGIIFWVQNVDKDKIERLERDIEMIQVDINKIKDNNTEILRVIGRLEGKLDNLK